MFYTGTARKNRLKGCPLKSEKDLKKLGRGACDFRVDEGHGIAATLWYDNRAVTMLSTLKGCNPTTSAKRWNKKDKVYNDVTLPAVIADYNQNMGGIDLLDSFLGKCRFKLRSRRWYMYLFWHFITVGVVNAWNVYRRNHTLLQYPSDMLKRSRFQATVAASLIHVNATRKRGRPSASPRA